MTQPGNAARTIRCAIYTRKSTDEGLDQDFNTLDAQREAAEAYIASQRHEGWVAISDHYDDGGFTGGNMERPALQRLLRDIEAGKVDCLVVYKVDRLSRSLLDFSRLIEILDRHNATFISVTQQFNTTNSMGRLTLNILLSFAQFEREIISERTRDKMSAARRKGKWTGGMLILGYDVEPKTKRLIVNEAEAARVREIFELYLRERALIPTVKELARRGWTTKRWQTVRETERGGKTFDKTALFYMLTNITYIGKTEYKGEIYEGEHPAIVSEDVWQRVQNLLRENRRTGGRDVRNKYGALLKGMLYCEACNAAMIHSYTIKGVKRYRYYVCSHAQKNGWDTCPTKSLPAPEMERIVIESIRSIGADDQLAGEVIEQIRKLNGDRLRLLESERDGLTQDLAKFNEELRRLITPARPQGQVNTAHMADLNEQIREAEQRVTHLREEILALQGTMIDEDELRSTLSIFDPIWDSLTPKERVRVMQLLIERIGYDPEASKISLTFHPTGIRSLQVDLMAGSKQN